MQLMLVLLRYVCVPCFCTIRPGVLMTDVVLACPRTIKAERPVLSSSLVSEQDLGF